MDQILKNIPGLTAALRHQRETDPVGYWLSYEATPQQFAEWLHWDREAQAGRYHPAYA